METLRNCARAFGTEFVPSFHFEMAYSSSTWDKETNLLLVVVIVDVARITNDERGSSNGKVV